MNNRFPLLTFISGLLRFFGSCVVLCGVVVGIYGFSERASIPLALCLPGAALLVIVGLLAIAFGELIGVFFAIEDNTRATVTRLSKFMPTTDAALATQRTPAEKFYYKTAAGISMGPVSPADLRVLHGLGTISDDTMVYPIGSLDWTTYSACYELHHHA